jgi:hypothetical protein
VKNESERDKMKTEERTINGMLVRKVKRGIWNVISRSGKDKGKVIFTGTLAEIKSAKPAMF